MFKLVSYYNKDLSLIYEEKSKFRAAWVDHVVYTRDGILGIMNRTGEVVAVSSRLLKNQDDIGNLFRPYYSQSDVDNLVILLKEHIAIAATIAEAAFIGESTSDLEVQWRANGEEIVNQFIAMNSYWAQSPLLSMWDEHLTLTLDEIKFRVEKNWTSDILTFDRIINHIYQLSDLLVNGIVVQSPLKFCRIDSEPKNG